MTVRHLGVTRSDLATKYVFVDAGWKYWQPVVDVDLPI